jgi:general secretion pathway protein J
MMTEEGKAGTSQSGFTLLELIIALGLFALISVAGLGLLDSVLNVQGRTEKRLDRLADIQRAMFVLQSDLDQVTRGAISGDANGIAFTRIAGGPGGAAVPVRYAVGGGALVRNAPAPQIVLAGISSARWRYHDGTSWVASWPLDEARKTEWPRAVSIEMQVTGADGPRGSLRRTIVLPVQPKDVP